MSLAAPPFRAPGRSETYFRDITRRAEDLIHGNIWNGLEISRLRAWLTNFSTDEEKYFAARLLDSFIFRSDDQTQALMLQLMQRALPDLTRQAPTPLGTLPDWLSRLRSNYDDPGIRLVPVIRNIDPPTKSGPLICRLLKRHLDLNPKWMIWPWNVKRAIDDGIRVFLLVDDFLGTGYQLRKFIRQSKLQSLLNDAYFIYAPLVAHARGLDRIKTKLPGMRVTAVEWLDETYSLFGPSSQHFNDGVNSPDSARDFYIDYITKKRFPSLGSMILGYSRLCISFAFAHGTPNASLPILWMQHDNHHALCTR